VSAQHCEQFDARRNSNTTKFRIKTYRSCKDTNLSPSDRLTALIGPNGVGKTNIMHAVLLLGLGDRSRYYTAPKDLFTNQCEIEAEFLHAGNKVLYKSSFTYSQNESPKDQVVIADENWNFKSITGKSQWIKDQILQIHSQSDNFRGDYIIRSGHRIFYADSKQLWSKKGMRHTTSRNIARKPSKEEIDTYDAIQTFRLGIKYYSASQFTNPALSPTSFEIDDEEDGRLSDTTQTRRLPHTRFVYDLYRASKTSEDSYEAFISLVGRAGIGLIDEIKWETVNISSETYEVRTGGRLIPKTRKRNIVIPIVQVGSSQLSFNQLSEGTLRTLAMLFYVITEKSELLLLEEPEVCVHHGLLKSVIEVIKEYASRKQIIISTHSESVLDYLKPDQIRIVERPEEFGTVVRSLDEIMSKK
jgi:ABC-type lipoprotein export system ATPase subunit